MKNENQNPIRRDDPRLTAYALGEGTPEERADVEAALAADASLAEEVESIRQTAELLEKTFAAEPLPKKEVPSVLQANRKWYRHPLPWIGVATACACLLFVLLLPALEAPRECARDDAKQCTEKSCDSGEHKDYASPSGPSSGRHYYDSKERTSASRTRPAAVELNTKPPAEASKLMAGKGSESRELNECLKGINKLECKQEKLPSDRRSKRYDISSLAETPPTALSAYDAKLKTSLEWKRQVHNTEAYDQIVENEFKRVSDEALSTFSIDVDTASYSNMRRFLSGNTLPPKGSVRIEELVNYFPYHYAPPKADDKTPFAAHLAVAECPWNKKHQLVRVALKGKEVKKEERPAMNLVFLLDVSGSMSSHNKLPFVKEGMKKLARQLDERDRIAIVVYAGASGLALPSTAVTPSGQDKILAALDNLHAGGSTNGGAGIKLAYATAAGNFTKEGVNRVILCTDGDFNVGVTNQSDLISLIEKKAKEKVFLTVLGFGMGNYKDSNLEKLADKGNGNYGYIDTLGEAEKLLVRQLLGTLVTIAKDVKIQVEFNPQKVKGYRLLGYENRVMAKEDFNDDTKDAGEIGAGHTVTAFYELVPAGSDEKVGPPAVDPLKYQPKPGAKAEEAPKKEAPKKEAPKKEAPKKEPEEATNFSNEILTLKLRYKQPDGDTSTKVTFPLVAPEKTRRFDQTDDDFRFAGSVVGFAMLLRDSKFKGTATYAAMLDWAEGAQSHDPHGYRREFIQLMRKAKSLSSK